MSAAGFTPIQLFRTTTASAAPTALSLADGELAINLTDEKLYFKNAAGVVKLLASNAGSEGTVTSVAVSGGTTGLTTSGGPITSSGTITLGGTLAVANGGTGVTTSTGTGSVVLNTSPTLVTPTLGVASATSISTGKGTVGAVAYGFTTNTNTGMWSPSSDAIAFSTAGSERVRVTSGGDVGIGTSSPGSRLDVVAQDAIRITGFQPFQTWRDSNDSNKGFRIQTAGGNTLFSNDATGGGTYTERMRIDSSGNVGIGTSSPAYRLDVVSADTSFGYAARLRSNATAATAVLQFTNAGVTQQNGVLGATDAGFLTIQADGAASVIGLRTNGAERARIDSSGNLGLGTSSPADRLSVNSAAGSGAVGSFNNSSTGSSLGGVVSSINGGGNNTNSWHYIGVTQTVAVWYLYGNGTTSYTSDIRVKKNVETTRDGYLDDVSKLRVVKYNWYNDTDDTPRELGFIAQEVEQVFPGLVQDAVHPTKDGVCHKVLKASVLVPILTKALQEANSKIDALEARMTALETSASTITFEGN